MQPANMTATVVGLHLCYIGIHYRSLPVTAISLPSKTVYWGKFVFSSAKNTIV